MAIKRGVQRDNKEVFLSEMSRHGSIRKACQVAGVSRRWVRETKAADEDFAIALADAIDDSVDRVDEVATRLALDGEEKLIRFILENKRFKKSTEDRGGLVKPIINIKIGD